MNETRCCLPSQQPSFYHVLGFQDQQQRWLHKMAIVSLLKDGFLRKLLAKVLMASKYSTMLCVGVRGWDCV